MNLLGSVRDNVLSSGSLASVLAPKPFLTSELTTGRYVGGIRNGEFLKGVVDNGMVSGGLKAGDRLGDAVDHSLKLVKPADLSKIRALFESSIADSTAIPSEAIRSFLELVEAVGDSMPTRLILKPEMRTFLTEKRALEMFSRLDDEALEQFRSILSQLSSRVTDRAFMGKADSKPGEPAEIALVEEIRSKLLQSNFTNGTLASIAHAARNYLDDTISIISDVVQVDELLNALSSEIGGLLNVGTLPVDVLSRVIAFRMKTLGVYSNLTQGVIPAIDTVGKEVAYFAVEVADGLAKLSSLIPTVDVEFLFELLAAADQIAVDTVDIKLSALEVISTMPALLIEPFLNVPSSVFTEVEIINREVFTALWGEMELILSMYTKLSNLLAIGEDVFPLEYFANLSRELIQKSGGAEEVCSGMMCFVQ